MPQFPRWKCHKEVNAAKISDVCRDGKGSYLCFTGGTPPARVTEEWRAKHMPSVGGYFVVYEDGYESYSPERAFEEGYHKV